jgi:hypothetical protein
MVASLPVWLGFVPSESLVVMCCHEPRGRMGLTLRLDLPAQEHEAQCVEDVERRVRMERATRVILAVYTDDEDPYPRRAMVEDLRGRLSDLIVTEAVLVRGGRFWSYLCQDPRCCPPEGTPVDEAADEAPLMLLKAEQVLEGKTTLPDRAALEDSLAGPAFLTAEAARQRCERAAIDQAELVAREGAGFVALLSMVEWADVRERFTNPPGELADEDAARLAVSLSEKLVRDALATADEPDLGGLMLLLEELCRRTPAPYDAPVCALLGWVLYRKGGGALLTIMIERSLRSDPTYELALLLDQMLQVQTSPDRIRAITREAAEVLRPKVSRGGGARRRGRR